MEGGNIGGFFRMVGSSDGTGSAPRRFGDYKTRRNNIERFMARVQGVDPDTGEVLNFKPSKTARNPYKMAYRSYGKNSFNDVKLPNASTVINLALIGGVGLVGYKLYTKFFGGADSIISDGTQKAAVTGATALAKTIVDSNQAKADSLTSTQTSLAAKGLTVIDLHKNVANYLHDQLNSMWVSDDNIVNTILKEDIQTFRLVSTAYGTRTIPTYYTWHFTSHALNNKDMLGTLKDHLNWCLSNDSIKKLSYQLGVI